MTTVSQPPAVDQNKFGDIGLALGTVRGARTWRVWPNGAEHEHELSGMFFKHTWMPGENLALCYHRPAKSYGRYPIAQVLEEPEPFVPKPIELGHLATCLCGFYAFYNGSNDYYVEEDRDKTLVTGMIEGYGETLIGSHGFRCTKARIVALTIHPDLPQIDEVIARYPGIPVFHDFNTMEREFPNDDGGAREEHLRKLFEKESDD